MLRVLATRRWLGALALAGAFAVLAFFLGQWQWHRYEERRERVDRIEAHYDAAPVPLGDLVGTDPPPVEREWTRVSVAGRYAAGEPLLVRNRPLEGTYGYEVLSPLTLDGGRTLLVNRGWVRNAESAQSRPEVPPAPAGTVTVSGWIRLSERSLGRDLPPGQLASINLPQAEQQLGTDLLGVYLVLDREQVQGGGTPQRPYPLERPDTALGPHQAYAFQWWGAMAVGFVLVYFGVRREHREGLGSEGTPARPRAARPRKVRVWDEEDA
ncbi:SURF1 family protein [Knoellia sp. 3-2P3]|uniref:SURF1 family cytochrome oxidase biogenesis protein n=1 Tax=unclassified Knoellia TaxID=2618719 RepID=UPI0023DC6ED9|nr:SURF1 family protein [Knoellia sp. 3-2P3]MDF2091940.1 SURF1 family protein [Knoellia sp. 3-2P3]